MRNSSTSSSQPTTWSVGDHDLDLRGEICPFTFVRAKLALEPLPVGAQLRIVVDNLAASRNVPASLQQWGQRVHQVHEVLPGIWTIDVERA